MRPRAECTVQAPVAPRRFSISYSSFRFSFGPQPIFFYSAKAKGAGCLITQTSQPLLEGLLSRFAASPDPLAGESGNFYAPTLRYSSGASIGDRKSTRLNSSHL